MCHCADYDDSATMTVETSKLPEGTEPGTFLRMGSGQVATVKDVSDTGKLLQAQETASTTKPRSSQSLNGDFLCLGVCRWVLGSRG